ncbi:MAG TPA: hypothetical protein V6D15_08470 [Oculatellaceae cyanobacterium]|jgi:hypothetical protein
MQDRSGSNDAPASVLFPLLLASLLINAGQHAFHSSRMELLKQGSNLYEQRLQQQEQAIAQLEKDKAQLEGKLAGYAMGRH